MIFLILTIMICLMTGFSAAGVIGSVMLVTTTGCVWHLAWIIPMMLAALALMGIALCALIEEYDS